jgi:ArsR family transcriptional regulator
MLEEARKRLGKASDGIELRIGEIEHLPMREGESDAAVANMVLHHLSSPRECIREMARVVRGGGVLIIADLDKHENEEMRRRFGHRWLGFDRKEMERWLVDAGFRVLEVRMYPARNGLAIALFKAVRGEGSR